VLSDLPDKFAMFTYIIFRRLLVQSNLP